MRQITKEADKKIDKLSWFKVSTLFRAKNSLSLSAYTVVDAVIHEISNSLDFEEEIFYHIEGKPLRYMLKEGKTFEVSFILPKSDIAFAQLFVDILHTYFQDSWNSRNIELLSLDHPKQRDLKALMKECPISSDSSELCLYFLTPVPFTPFHPKKRSHIDGENFLNLLTARIRRIFGIEFTLSYTENLMILPYWRYEELVLPSFSQEGQRYINGCIGPVYIKGNIESLFPLILICSELHTGSALSHGRGYYILKEQEEQSYLSTLSVEETLRFYIEKNKDIADQTQRDSALKELYKAVHTGDYKPHPQQTFQVKDSNLNTEKFHWKDLVLMSFLYKILKAPIDNILPLTVLSFRPHIGQKEIEDTLNQALEQGYTKMALFTVGNIYNRIDHDKLIQTLKALIPSSDHSIVELIQSFLKAPIITDNKVTYRKQGIPYGSPLSPLLSNIYLYELDRTLNRIPETIALHYADTYLILSREQEFINKALSEAEKILKDYNLSLNLLKNNPNEEIKFVGITLNKIKKIEPLRKTLYICNPEQALNLNSETITIKNSDGNTTTIPLNRVSEIYITEDTTITTPLIRKCQSLGIPLIIAPQFSSSLVLFRKDYKSHYETIAEHTIKYRNLSEGEKLFYAKQIAELKIRGYENLFRQKRHLELEIIIQTLRQLRQKIIESKRHDILLGYEANAAKKIYSELNLLIKHQDFQIKSRNRARPDRVNSLLNLCSHLIFNKIRTTLHAKGINPYLGFLHSSENRYESLAADIQELLRAKTDGFIIKLINLRVITAKDFEETDLGYRLKSNSIQKFLNHFEEFLNTSYSNEGKTLYDFIRGQTDKIKEWIKGESELVFEIPW